MPSSVTNEESMPERSKLRVAAVSDIHYHKEERKEMRQAFAQASEEADVLLLCGDLTDYGMPEEAKCLIADLEHAVDIPILGVLGNHDFESGQHEEVCSMLSEAGVRILDGDAVVIDGVGFAGVSGFGGGFDQYMLNAWGEPLIKEFVQQAVQEALKLEKALSSLDVERRIVMMHYAPICATVEGEPEQIFPFLGSSRLEAPLNRFGVLAAFHGHAHKGRPEGKTTAGVPVYNVALRVLRDNFPDRPPYRIFEVDLSGASVNGEQKHRVEEPAVSQGG